MSEANSDVVQQKRRQKRRALRKARAHLADPNSKLGRLMTAYFKQQASDRPILTLPEA